MNHLSRFIEQHKRMVITFFTVATLICVFLFFCTPVNYNMTDYLPSQANSTIALEKMGQEFDQPIPNLNVMAEDVSLVKALELKQQIADADYVKEVLWLDDTLDIKEPLEAQDTASVESYYKDGDALYMVTVEDGNERAAIASIREALDGNCKFSGSASEQAESQSMALQETVRAILLLVPVIILILILATDSWLEPVFYLLTLGVAVLINLGTNIFLGDISFVTLAAAPILQLAVSLDYAVFFSHSFTSHKQRGLPPVEALRMAMISSKTSISASMLTTLFGFVALLFMKFRIGFDMGISLVKGVLLSFICVMVFFPAVLLYAGPLIDKTRHRRLIPSFKNIGNGIMKLRVPVGILLLLLAFPAFLGQSKNQYFYGTSEKTPVQSEAYEIEQKFGVTNTLVLMVPTGDSTKETLLCEELKNVDHVTGVTSYAAMVSNKIPTAFLDDSIVEQFYSDNYARIILTANCAYEGEEAFALVTQVRNLADSYYPDDTYTCGQSANMYDMKTYVEADNRLVSLITVISIYIILALMTKNWLTPLLLILTIKCSIWLNMSVPYFSGKSLSYLGYLIVSTVQMGATIDYAILLTDTYQLNRKTMKALPAIKKTLGDVFQSILISAAVLAVAGFCLGLTSSNEIVSILGYLISRGAILAILMVVFMLPILLLLTDRICPHTAFSFNFKKKKERELSYED